MFGTNKRANAQKIVIGVLAFSVLFALIAACSLEGAVDDIYQQVLNDNPYIVSFDTGTGGDPVPSKTIVKGHLVPEPDQPSNTNGDTFGWWFTDSAKTTDPWDFQNGTVSSDMTLYASWDGPVVVFFGNGGTYGNGGPTYKVEPTATGSMPATTDFVRDDDYICTGWVDKDGHSFTSLSSVGASMAVYAQWKPIYTVTFNANGGTPATTTKTVTWPETTVGAANIPTVTWDNHVFKGWNIQANGSGGAFDGTTTVTGNITVYAQWVSTDATIKTITIGGVSVASTSLGTPHSAWSSVSPGAVTLSSTQATTPAIHPIGATGSSQQWNVTPDISTNPTTGWKTTTPWASALSNGSIVWFKSVAEDTTTTLIYAIEVTVTVGDTTPPSLSAGSINRTSDTAATIGFTTDEAGTAYYLVLASGDTAPTSAAVKAGTLIGAVPSGAITGKAVTLTAGAKDIYVVVEDAAGNISTPLQITAGAYVPADTTPPILSAGSVSRTSDTAATIDFTTDEAGEAFYIELASGATAPSGTDVTAGTSLGNVIADAITGMAVTLTVGARDIYVVVKDAAGNISDPLLIPAAAYL